nr:hypothetical protein [Tanacetum cinerariifolium]
RSGVLLAILLQMASLTILEAGTSSSTTLSWVSASTRTADRVGVALRGTPGLLETRINRSVGMLTPVSLVMPITETPVVVARVVVVAAMMPITTLLPLVWSLSAIIIPLMEDLIVASSIGNLSHIRKRNTHEVVKDIMFAVCACARFQVTLKVSHLHAVKRIFSDYAGASLDMKSTTRACQFLGCRLISWQCKKQTIVATSSTEAEYVAAASCYAQVLWIQNHSITAVSYKLMLFGLTKDAVKLMLLGHNMVRNVDSPSKFLMYPRFLQVLINNQLDDLSSHTTNYISPPLTQKVFVNMKRIGKGISGVETLLFATMLVQPQAAAAKEDEEDEVPAAPTPPSFTHEPSPPTHEPITIPPQAQPAPPSSPPQEQPTTTSASDMSILNTLMETCTTLSHKVAALEQDKVAQALEIIKLKQRVKKLEKQKRSKSSGLKRLRKVGGCIQIGGKIAEIDVDEDITLVNMETEVDLYDDLQGRIERKDDDNATKLNVFNDEEMQEKHLDNIRKYQSLKRKSISIAQAKKNMIVYLKFMVGYKMEHFKGMSYNKVRLIFKREYNKVQTLFKPDKDVAEPTKKRVSKETLLQDSFKKLRAKVEVSSSESTQDTPTDDPKEMSEEDDKNMLEIIPVSEFKVESLQVKYPFIDWEIHYEGSRSYWKIIRVGGITQATRREGSGTGPERQETIGGAMAQIRSEGVLIQSIDPPLSIGYTVGSGEDRMEHDIELTDHEISSLKKRVTKLEKRQSLRILSFHSFRVGTSKRHGLGKRKVSKQWRKNLKSQQMFQDIDDVLDDGADIEMIVEDKGNGEKRGSTSEKVSAARPKVSTAELKTPPTTPTLFDDDDVTIDNTLVKTKNQKAKEKGIAFKDVNDSARPIRSITTLQPLPTTDPKDKEAMTKRERQEEASKVALAEMYDKVQAQIDVDRELAVRLTHKEQEKYTVEERFTHAQLKRSEEDEKRIGSRKKRAAGSSSKHKSPKKQKVNDQESKDSDKEHRKCLKVVLDDDKVIDYETLDVKSLIVDCESQVLGTNEVGDVHVYKLTRLDESYKHLSTFSRMLEVLDRQDMLDLHKIIMERFLANDPEGYDLILWGDLKTLVELSEDDEIWRNQQD